MNKTSSHAIKPDTQLHLRCTLDDKAHWKAAAKRAGLTLSQWVVLQLSAAATDSTLIETGYMTAAGFNAKFDTGHAFTFGGRLVSTRSEAWIAVGGDVLVKVNGRGAGVRIDNLRLV